MAENAARQILFRLLLSKTVAYNNFRKRIVKSLSLNLRITPICFRSVLG